MEALGVHEGSTDKNALILAVLLYLPLLQQVVPQVRRNC